MNTLFKELAAGAPIFALVKGDELKYYEGSIISVGAPRMEMPKIEGQPNPLQLPTMKNIVDVTYNIDGKNYTDAVDVTASVFPTGNPGAVTLVATEKEAIIRELHATQKSAENYIVEAKNLVPKREKQVEQCKQLIAELDTAFREKQETEQRFSKIEQAQKEQGSKLDKILALLEK